MSEEGVSLCFPDEEKSCFACCPPIRPAGYQHSHYEGIIKRILRENTRAYCPEERRVRPITGFSCWALGYLDADCRLVGCLLHPARNLGVDLRFRVNYGEKCRRETCPEAAIFDKLHRNAQAFWLRLVEGLDAVSYSSRDRNPLFHLLNWGPEILGAVAAVAPAPVNNLGVLVESFPFLGTRLSPRAWAYPVKRLVSIRGAEFFREQKDTKRLETGLIGLLDRLALCETATKAANALPSHVLPMDRSFLDFLRLSSGIRRISPEDARALRCRLDEGIERLGRSLARSGRPGAWLGP